MSDVEAKTIEYDEELRALDYSGVRKWIAQKFAELEARMTELESWEDPNRPILPDLIRGAEATKEVMLKTLEQGAREASERGC